MKEFKKPDVTAPRYRPDAHNILSNKFFEKFKSKFSKYGNISRTEISKIIKTYNQTVYQTVIDKRDGVQLPEMIGWLFIGTCQQAKKNNIDFAKSTKYGVTVTNKNWETDGKLAKIFFTTYAPKHKMKNREFWKFVACRDFKRQVAKTYPENWNMYVVVEPTQKLRLTYEKNFLKDKQRYEQNLGLKDYNDFNL